MQRSYRQKTSMNKTHALEPQKERLHKFIARCGICSRRKAEQLILEGAVTLNGEKVTELGVKVSLEDEVIIDGKQLIPPKLFYVLMNKPKGVITTLSDPEKRNTVMEYLPDLGCPLKPVGRLDKNTSGLLIFTNDGDFAAMLTHPKHAISKEYLVTIRGELSEKNLKRLERGVFIDGRKTAPAEILKLGFDEKKNYTKLKIILKEGRNRQIRKMIEIVGHTVFELVRTRIGSVHLHKMAAGTCRMLGKAEVEKLKKIATASSKL